MNIIGFSFILGLTGLISKYGLFNIASLLYVLLSLIVLYIIILFVSIIISKILNFHGKDITLHLLTSAALYVVIAFILGYNAYGSDLLSDLINGKDLSDSIVEMILYLYLMCSNIFILMNYGTISLINKIKAMIKKTT
jgi:hypothetical protein